VDVSGRGQVVTGRRSGVDASSHLSATLTSTELAQIDEQINRWIRADLPVHTNIMPLQEALTTGAMALFW